MVGKGTSTSRSAEVDGRENDEGEVVEGKVGICD